MDATSSASPAERAATVTPAEIEQLVRALADVMRDGTITEMKVAFGPVSIQLSGGGNSQPAHFAAETTASTAAHDIEVAAGEGVHVVTSPMIGTFYASASPGELALVEVGDRVEAGQVIGIIEAMKIMNEITADGGGIVTAILVDNGQAVEYGSPLIHLSAAS